MPTKQPTFIPRTLHDAELNLSRFIRQQYCMQRVRLGFGVAPSLEAPSTFAELQEECSSCLKSGKPLRVSSLNSEPVIYDSPTTNYMFRYWHDTNHVILGLSFEPHDEFALAGYHLETLCGEGFGRETLESDLLLADTWGQAYFQWRTGRYVGNQLRFDTNFVLLGFEEAFNGEVAALQESDVVTRTDLDGEPDPDRDHDHGLDRDFEVDLHHHHAVKP